MKIVRESTEYYKIIGICPFNDERNLNRTLITVSRRKGFGIDTWLKSDINWSAIGATSIENTQLFAEGLLEAVKLAKELDAE